MRPGAEGVFVSSVYTHLPRKDIQVAMTRLGNQATKIREVVLLHFKSTHINVYLIGAVKFPASLVLSLSV